MRGCLASSPQTSPLGVGLDQIPLKFPLCCGPGPDPLQLPPVGCGPGDPPQDQAPPPDQEPPRTRHPLWYQASPWTKHPP